MFLPSAHDEGRGDVKCKEVQALISKGDLSGAQAKLTEIEQSEGLTPFCRLHKLLLELEQTIEKCYYLKGDDNRRQTAEELASDFSHEGCRNAQALLIRVFKSIFPEVIVLPEEQQNSMKLAKQMEPDTIQKSSLKVFPNPAKEIVYFSCSGLEVTNGRITILNMLGEQLYSLPVNNNSFISMGTEKLSKGVYFVCLLDGNKVIQRSKFAVIK